MRRIKYARQGSIVVRKFFGDVWKVVGKFRDSDEVIIEYPGRTRSKVLTIEEFENLFDPINDKKTLRRWKN